LRTVGDVWQLNSTEFSAGEETTTITGNTLSLQPKLPDLQGARGSARRDSITPSDSAQEMTKEHQIFWNGGSKEWFCVRCGRTSDHITKLDAERELSGYDCILAQHGDDSENRVMN